MAHISTTNGGIRQPNLGIQVCTIQVHLSAVLVDNLACIRNAIFKYTERRRVRDLWAKLGSQWVWESRTCHKCGQVVLVLLSFGLEVGEIKVSICMRFDRDDFQTSHNSGLQQ